jgi:hypothetical protein
MARKLRVFLAVLATTLGLMAVPTATSASALGGEWLGCMAYPGQAYYDTYCIGSTASGRIIVDFVVMNETAPSTYSWAIPAGYQTQISAGCRSNTNYCQLNVGRGYQEIPMSVTLTQGGATATLTAYAYIEPMCGNQYC